MTESQLREFIRNELDKLATNENVETSDVSGMGEVQLPDGEKPGSGDTADGIGVPMTDEEKKRLGLQEALECIDDHASALEMAKAKFFKDMKNKFRGEMSEADYKNVMNKFNFAYSDLLKQFENLMSLSENGFKVDEALVLEHNAVNEDEQIGEISFTDERWGDVYGKIWDLATAPGYKPQLAIELYYNGQEVVFVLVEGDPRNDKTGKVMIQKIHNEKKPIKLRRK